MSDLHRKAVQSVSPIEAFYTRITSKTVHNTTVHSPYYGGPDTMSYNKFNNTLTIIENFRKRLNRVIVRTLEHSIALNLD